MTFPVFRGRLVHLSRSPAEPSRRVVRRVVLAASCWNAPMRCVVPTLLALAACAVAEDVPTIRGFTADTSEATHSGALAPRWGTPVPTETAIVVAADRRPMEAARTTATVDVMDGEDRREQGYPTTTTALLRGVPGVDLGYGGGFLGSSGSLRLRGTGSGDTRILIDGIPLADAGEISGQRTFGGIASAGIDRVEVVRGPQSGLYGSAAIGGVVDLRTRRPTARNLTGFHAEGGSFGTALGEGWATGSLNRTLGYALSVGGLRTDGYSATTDEIGRPADHELDGAEQSNGTARIEWRPLEQVHLYGAVRGEATNEEIDAGFPVDSDDRVSWGRVRSLRGSAGGSLDLGLGEVVVDAARTRTARDYERNSTFGTSATRYVSVDDFLGLRATGEILSPERRRTAFDRALVTVGLDLTRNHADVNEYTDFTGDDTLRGLWGQVLLGGQWWEFSQTARQDQHSREGGAGTWRTGLAVFAFDGDLKLHGSAGTAFRAPSLYQMTYGTPVGNDDLDSVRTRGQDLGFVARIPGNLTVEQTAFRTEYLQNIDYWFDGITYDDGYRNTGGYRVEGLESAATLNDGQPGLRVRLTYTAQRTDRSDDEIAANQGFTYLPRHKASIQPSFHQDRWWAALRLDATGRAIASQYDARAEVAGSAVLGASAGYRPAKGWEVYARGENLANTAYERVPGYSTSPLAGYGGVTAEF